MANPEKNDIEKVFLRLRSIPTNKSCFDCGAKNPTWATVTYGVFICIDCSAVHRSLGVHLTFVRSTNLDTNWTWIQLRQMQLGGNANANQFFRQHNCNTSDAQQKYNSRAAQLYRDKLLNLAQQAMRLHGNTVHIDHHDHLDETQSKDEDFFSNCTNLDNNIVNSSENNGNPVIYSQFEELTEFQKLAPSPNKLDDNVNFGGAPSVDFLNSTLPSEPVKSTIGVRKIQPKKSGIGAKKGLGATRVKTNFADIEQRATMADQLKETIVQEKKLTAEEEAETIASVRLAYQDLSMKQNKEEERLKSVDPTKAKQMERLGMGFNFKSGAVSHSAVNDMQTINQESTPKITSKSFERDSTNDMFEDYILMYSNVVVKNDRNDRDLSMMGFETIEPIETKQKNIQSMFSPSATNSKSKSSSSISDQPSYSRNNRSSAATSQSSANEGDAAQKKFGGAKAISSDQYFNNDSSSFERATNLNRFQGSNSISSSDYFGDNSSSSNTTLRNSNSNRSFDLQYSGPDLDEVKESVRQGVTKVAGKLSNLANNMMSSLQDKYGY